MIRDIAIAAIGAALVVAATLLGSMPAKAHKAPTGWEYDPRCCSGKDCAPLKEGAVKALSDGYHVYIAVGDHPMATLKPIEVVIPYGSHKLRESPDGFYHGCFSQQYKNNAGDVFQNSFCLYVPPMGY